MKILPPLDGSHGPVGYLKAYDPEANDGCGEVELTLDLTEAYEFKDPEHALATRYTVPKCRPYRDDGMPNRPMLAFVCEILSKQAAFAEYADLN
jgi:hypothetical protein